MTVPAVMTLLRVLRRMIGAVGGICVVLGSTPVAAAEELATLGDIAQGARLFRLHCAQCHGADKSGAGYLSRTLKNPPPRNLGDPGFLVRRTNEDLISIITLGGRAVSAHFTMPTFGGQLEVLDAWDLVAFLRKDLLSVADFYPTAGKYSVQEFELQDDAKERLRQSLPEPTLTGVLALSGDEGAARGPEYLAPSALPSVLGTRPPLGTLVFGSVQIPGMRPIFVGMSVDASGVIERIRPQLERSHKAKENTERMLMMYEGQKGRLSPSGAVQSLAVPVSAGKEGPAVAKELAKLYAQALEVQRLYGLAR